MVFTGVVIPSGKENNSWCKQVEYPERKKKILLQLTFRVLIKFQIFDFASESELNDHSDQLYCLEKELLQIC